MNNELETSTETSTEKLLESSSEITLYLWWPGAETHFYLRGRNGKNGGLTFTCPTPSTDTFPGFWATILLSHPSSRRSLSCLVELLLECFWAIWIHELEQLSVREKCLLEYMELCCSIWSWFSFPIPKLNLGEVCQVEPGYRERAQNPKVSDCIYMFLSVLSALLSPKQFTVTDHIYFIGASSSTYLLDWQWRIPGSFI